MRPSSWHTSSAAWVCCLGWLAWTSAVSAQDHPTSLHEVFSRLKALESRVEHHDGLIAGILAEDLNDHGKNAPEAGVARHAPHHRDLAETSAFGNTIIQSDRVATPNLSAKYAETHTLNVTGQLYWEGQLIRFDSPSQTPTPAPTSPPTIEPSPLPSTSPTRDSLSFPWFIQSASTLNSFIVPGFTFPANHWTLETWVKRHSSGSDGPIFSFASSSYYNCFIMKAGGLPLNSWVHFVVTWDGSTTKTYANGVAYTFYESYPFCGTSMGYLVMGQEQDCQGGCFDSGDVAPIFIDTLAVYKVAWSASYVASLETADKSACTETDDYSLVSLYVGDGTSTTVSDRKGGNPSGTLNGGTVLSSEAGVAGVCARVTISPTFQWFIETGTTNNWFAIPGFTFPASQWTLETWIKRYSADYDGPIFSFAHSSNDNCFISKAGGLSVNSWIHFVVSWDGSSTKMYADGSPYTFFQGYPYCGASTGTLVMGQEQDCPGGCFHSADVAPIYIDTLAVYNTAWSATFVASLGSSKSCVDTSDSSLVSHYAGDGGTSIPDREGNNPTGAVYGSTAATALEGPAGSSC